MNWKALFKAVGITFANLAICVVISGSIVLIGRSEYAPAIWSGVFGVLLGATVSHLYEKYKNNDSKGNN